MPLSEFIKDLKNSPAINIRDFSRFCGIDPSYLYKICRGYQPSPRLAKVIVKMSGGKVTLQDLYK